MEQKGLKNIVLVYISSEKWIIELKLSKTRGHQLFEATKRLLKSKSKSLLSSKNLKIGV